MRLLLLKSKQFKFFFHSHPKISLGSNEYNFRDLKAKLSHLRDLPDTSISLADVKIIIGRDAYHLQKPIEFCQSINSNHPIAIRTNLGWTISGPNPSQVTSCLNSYVAV